MSSQTPSTPQREAPSTPNTSTSTTSSVVDSAIVVQSDDGTWLTVFDPQTKRHYYHNKSTGETTWSLPINLSSPNLLQTARQSSPLDSPVGNLVSPSNDRKTPNTPTLSIAPQTSEQHIPTVRSTTSQGGSTATPSTPSLHNPQSTKTPKTPTGNLHHQLLQNQLGTMSAPPNQRASVTLQRSQSQDLSGSSSMIGDSLGSIKAKISNLHALPIKGAKSPSTTEQDQKSGLFVHSQANSDNEDSDEDEHVETVVGGNLSMEGLSVKTEGELAPGWESAIDSTTGRTYYFNRDTQKSSWERPLKSNHKSIHLHSPSVINSIEGHAMNQPATSHNIGSSNSVMPVRRATINHESAPALEGSQETSDALPKSANGDHTLAKYGGTHFQKFKKGIFKKQVKVEKLLEFQKDRIPQTLHVIKLEQYHEKALRCFELIQLFMGDRTFDKCSPTVKQVVKSGTNVHDFFLAKGK